MLRATRAVGCIRVPSQHNSLKQIATPHYSPCREGSRTRITSKFRLPSRRSYIRSHGYPFRAEGEARDATGPARVRSAPARAVPERHARREGRAFGPGRRGDRSPPQGGDPVAPAGAGAPTAGSRAGQPRLYGPAVAPAVEVLWQATEHIGPHRLHRFVPELLDRLAHNGELRLAPEVDQLVRQASPATLGQLLASAPASYFKRPDHERSRGYPPHGRSRSPTAPTAADNERPVAHAFTSTGPGKPSPIPISHEIPTSIPTRFPYLEVSGGTLGLDYVRSAIRGCPPRR